MQYPQGMTLRPIEAWPGAFTSSRKQSPFRAAFSDTIAKLHTELRRLDQMYSNPPSVLQIALREQDFRIDGMPRANAVPAHPGVILSIEARGKRGALSFPCDTFTHWHDNLRAITLTLEALRKVDRYGVTQTGQQYRGWQAIEAAPALDAKLAACAVLARMAWPNENDDCQARWAHKIASDPEIARNTYRQARAKAHPDVNLGARAMWNAVEDAATALRGLGVVI